MFVTFNYLLFVANISLFCAILLVDGLNAMRVYVLAFQCCLRQSQAVCTR